MISTPLGLQANHPGQSPHIASSPPGLRFHASRLPLNQNLPPAVKKPIGFIHPVVTAKEQLVTLGEL